MHFRNILSQAVFLIALTTCVFVIANIGLNYNSKSGLQLETLWKYDIVALQSKNKLPASWSEIRLVDKVSAPGDSNAEKWVKNVSPPVEINPNGTYKLEILFISNNENGSTRAVIRHHLIHLPSGNSVWELSRTYILN